MKKMPGVETLFKVGEFLLWKVLVPAFYFVFFLFPYSWKLLKRMTRWDFYKTYPCSMIMLVAVLVLSLWDTDGPKMNETLSREKIVCGSFYFFMTSIFWIEYLKHQGMRRIDLNWVWFPCIVAPILLSGTIEILQHYVFVTHSGELLDWICNCIGVAASAILWVVFIARRRKIKVVDI